MAAESALVINIDTRRGVKNVKSLDSALKKVEKTGTKTEKKVGKVTSAIKKETSAFRALTAAATAFVAVGLGRSIFDTVMAFQSMKAQLKTLLGSQEKANGAFAELQEFARSTPFALDQSVAAFQRLLSLGLNPTEETLYSIGNTATAMGKDMLQLSEAIADATTNEFERLKEFGIKAKQAGDQVTFTFQGVETTVQKSATAIKDYIIGIGKTTFPTAMSDQMDGLKGQVSNLGDEWRALKYELGKGLENSTFLKDIATSIAYVRKRIPLLINSFQQFQIEAFLVLDSFTANFEKMINNLTRLWIKGTGGLEVIWAKAIDGMLEIFADLAGGAAYLAELFPDSQNFAKQLRQIETNANNAAKAEARINAEVKAAIGPLNQRNKAIDSELKTRAKYVLARRNESEAFAKQFDPNATSDSKLDDFLPPALQGKTSTAAPKKTAAQKKYDSAEDGLRDYIADQQFLATTIGETAEQVEILNLRRDVASASILAETAAQRSLVEQLGLEGEALLRQNQELQLNVELKEKAADLIKTIDGGMSEYNATLEEYNTLREKGFVTDQQYNTLLKELQMSNAALLDSSEQARLGIEAALGDYSDSIGSTFDAVRGVANTALGGLEDAFVELAMTGKLSMKDMANSILADITRVIAKQLILQAITGAMGGGGGAGLGSILGAANGAAFNKGKVVPFAKGGVVSDPTMFKFGNRTGMMGEAGPEAVLPLKRTAGGELGVKVAGNKESKTKQSQNNKNVEINMGGIHISTPDADSFNESRDQVMGTVYEAMGNARRNM